MGKDNSEKKEKKREEKKRKGKIRESGLIIYLLHKDVCSIVGLPVILNSSCSYDDDDDDEEDVDADAIWFPVPLQPTFVQLPRDPRSYRLF